MADDVLISQLPDAAALASTDVFEVEQGAGPTTSGKSTLSALLAYMQAGIAFPTVTHPFSQTLALSDLTSVIVSGATVVGAWIPDFAGNITSAMIAVVMAQSSSGVVTVDCLKNGVSIFATKPSIDANENTSLTGSAAVLAVNPTAFIAGDKFTFVINAAGTGAKGLQVTLSGTR